MHIVLYLLGLWHIALATPQINHLEGLNLKRCKSFATPNDITCYYQSDRFLFNEDVYLFIYHIDRTQHREIWLSQTECKSMCNYTIVTENNPDFNFTSYRYPADPDPMWIALSKDCLAWRDHLALPEDFTYHLPYYCTGEGENAVLTNIVNEDYRDLFVSGERTGFLRDKITTDHLWHVVDEVYNSCYLNDTRIDTLKLGFMTEGSCIKQSKECHFSIEKTGKTSS